MKEKRQDRSSADAVAKLEEEDKKWRHARAFLQSGGGKDVSKNVSSFEVLKRELDAPKPTANKVRHCQPYNPHPSFNILVQIVLSKSDCTSFHLDCFVEGPVAREQSFRSARERAAECKQTDECSKDCENLVLCKHGDVTDLGC